ncbi:hypothetical protein TrCOL_g12353 [Triparma columacea]|uniref:Fanconi-associated nuclease n=1 Tax=Triparma columacea TaxID=722753 RepID=A0A9W7GM63_9STRA|nr:hypothetical protein TrCOL_g12353 [Triparma columacea]
MERRGYHDLAAYILGGIVEDGGGGMKRRTVGKVCERFLVDWKHDYNKRGKEGKERGKERGILEEGNEGQEYDHSVLSLDACPPPTFKVLTYTFQSVQANLVNLLTTLRPDSKPALPYSSYLTLTSRLKIPTESNEESMHLGIDAEYNVKTDYCTANAIRKTNCVENGFETTGQPTVNYSGDVIMNDVDCNKGKSTFVVRSSDSSSSSHPYLRGTVENLALSEHSLGHVGTLGSNWFGWHDEGMFVKRLFRLIVKKIVPGMTTLTPWTYETLELNDDTGGGGGMEEEIEIINELNTPESVIDYVDALVRDFGTDNDYDNIRTLSMLASGMGGSGLASVIRALAYDLRHYGAGMPDLTLVRVSYEGEEGMGGVDLGRWIGEEFGEVRRGERNFIRNKGMIRDKDEGNLLEIEVPVAATAMSTPPPTPPRVPQPLDFSPLRPKQSFLGFTSVKGKKKTPRVTNGSISCEIPEGGWETGPKGRKEERVLVYKHDWDALDLTTGETVRVVGLDFDDTLVVSNRGSTDWKLRFPHVIEALRRIVKLGGGEREGEEEVQGEGEIHGEGGVEGEREARNDEGSKCEGGATSSESSESPARKERVVLAIVTNESLGKFKKEPALRKALHTKAAKVVEFCKKLDLPVITVMPTAKDGYRKGNGRGAWDMLTRVIEEDKGAKVNLETSCFVGDAGGGMIGVYDREFAKAAGIKYFREKEFFGWKGEGSRDGGGGGTGESGGGEEGIGEEEEEEVTEKLKLEFEGRKVKVEVLFSEVKSANDTLDKRQETWLNILESAGIMTRVCKFKESLKKKEKKRASPTGEEKKAGGKKKKKGEKKGGSVEKKFEGVEDGEYGVRRITQTKSVELEDDGKVVESVGVEKVAMKTYKDGKEANREFELEVKNAKRMKEKNRRGKSESSIVVELWTGKDRLLREELGRK